MSPAARKLLDLALVEIKDPVPGKGLRLAASLPNPGARIVVIGSPRDFSASMSEGIVSAIRQHKPHGTVVQMTAAISPGNSGGPVLTTNGVAVGVVSFFRVDGQSLNFAIPTNEIPAMPVHEPIPLATFNKERNRNPGVARHDNGRWTANIMPDHAVPTGAIERVLRQDRKDLAEAARYAMLLPNGDIINLFRFFRTVELESLDRTASAADRHYEALGPNGETRFRRGDGSRIDIVVERQPFPYILPPNPQQTTQKIIADLPTIGLDVPIEIDAHMDGMVLCRIERMPILIRNHGNAPFPPRGVWADRIYFPVGSLVINGELINVYDACDPMGSRPSLDEMAYHAERGGAAVVLHSYRAIEKRGTSRERTGSGFSARTESRSIITGLTYRWSERFPKIRFTDPKPVRDEGNVPDAPPTDPVISTAVTHTVALKDGRTLKGRLVSQSRNEIVFVVVVGSIEHEMTIKPGDVAEIRSSDRPAGSE